MANSVSRGRVEFEDGTFGEDVEVFDDGTWINHSLLAKRQREAGQMIKAAGDRAQRIIKVPTIQPCTVLRVSAAEGIAGGVAVVHVDGDKAASTREVTISSTYIPAPGDRASLQYTPPFGASIVAPIGAGGDPTGSIKYNVSGDGSTQEVLADDVAVLALICEEHITGSMLSNIEDQFGLWVPVSGVYSCHVQATLYTTTPPTTGEVQLSIYALSPDSTLNEIAFDFSGLGRDRLHASRAAVSVVGGTRFYAVGTNTMDVDVGFINAQLDVAWQVPSDGERKDCYGGGG